MKKISLPIYSFYFLTMGLTQNLLAASPQWQCQNKTSSQAAITIALQQAVATSENQQTTFQDELKKLRDQLIQSENEKKSLLSDTKISDEDRKLNFEKLNQKRSAIEGELFKVLNDNKQKKWKNSSELVALIQSSVFWGNYINNNYPYCEILLAYQQQEPQIFQTELQRLYPKADKGTATQDIDLANPESPETQFQVLTNMITTAKIAETSQANDPE